MGAKNAFTFGTDNFKTSTLYRHTTHRDHQRALIAPQKSQNFKQAVNKVLSNEEKGMTSALKMVYWLTQEGMPLSKYGSMLRFMSSEMLKFVFGQGASPPPPPPHTHTHTHTGALPLDPNGGLGGPHTPQPIYGPWKFGLMSLRPINPNFQNNPCSKVCSGSVFR